MDIDNAGDLFGFPPVVELNVGGMCFTTSLETLQGDRFGPDCNGSRSMLAAMFSGRIPTQRDPQGRYFIDRDGRHFQHILNYLRDGQYPIGLPMTERLEIEREASFYGLEALASHLRADLAGVDAKTDPYSPPAQGHSYRAVGAAEGAELVLNQCLQDWPEFPQYVQGVLDKLLVAGGVMPNGGTAWTGTGQSSERSAGVAFGEEAAASLQSEFIAEVQIELAHVDPHSKAWRWSDRKTGVNSVVRAKLLRCHLQRLGYTCRIVPVFDKREVAAYVLQVELPMPQ
mmetsp:Transcript_31670/g.73970  ORF Transcript_31670/g.73970 Transcript_31670/m.73970 type:complete len:285 (-) Transcript_31670:83-937(-)